MKKLLLLIVATLALTSCEFLPKGKTGFTNYSKHVIEFRDNKIVLSDEYTKTTPEEFTQRLDSLNDELKFKKLALAELERVQAKKVDFELFVDDTNVENYVFIYTRDFVQFDEHSAAKYVSKLNGQFLDEANKQEIKYKRIHGRYFFTPNSKIVKLKYLKAHKKERKFEAEYIVSLKTGGIGLHVSNVDNVDFEKSIKRLASK